MTTARALIPGDDRELLFEAFSWMEGAPEWMYGAHPDFWPPDFVSFYAAAEERLDVGVFLDGQLAALLMLTPRAAGFEVDLACRRKTPPAVLEQATRALRERLFEAGAAEIFTWVLARNRGAVRVAEAAGLRRDGVRVLKGTLRGRPAEWVRLSRTSEQEERH